MGPATWRRPAWRSRAGWSPFTIRCGSGDLAALAHGQLASCLRLNGERHAALRESRAAWRLLAAGTGDPAVEAELLELDAFLLWDGQEYAAAVDHLRRAHGVFAGSEGAADGSGTDEDAGAGVRVQEGADPAADRSRTGDGAGSGQGIPETGGAAADPLLALALSRQVAGMRCGVTATEPVVLG